MRQFALSKTLLNLFQYKKDRFSQSGYTSKATEDQFFISPKGKENPLRELSSTLELLKSDPGKLVGHVQKPFICAFPARFYHIKKTFPEISLKKSFPCKELEEWTKQVGEEELYLIYAGPYPQNPASMFGHSFLRFSGKRNSLLDYVVGFQASVDPNDNSITYSIKGITGGYVGFYNIKPYYQDIGLYNNLESRGLWEYKINISKDQQKLLLYHLWEISNNTGFNYYFLDENCSHYILTLFEFLFPNENYTQVNEPFLYPIESVKKISQLLDLNSVTYRAPIKEKIKEGYRNLSEKDRELFLDARNDQEEIKKMDSPKTLRLINQYWKFKNYRENIQLESQKKSIMETGLQKMAKIKIEDLPKEEPVIKSTIDPTQIHQTKKISVGLDHLNQEDALFLKFNLGYHALEDSSLGVPIPSYIDFLGFKLRMSPDVLEVSDYTLVDILALEDFEPTFKNISWNVKVYGSNSCIYCDKRTKNILEGGIGISKIYQNLSMWIILGPQFNIGRHDQTISPMIKTGVKYNFASLSSLGLEGLTLYHNDLISNHTKAFLSHYLNPNQGFILNASYQDYDSQSSLELSFRQHF